jgi:hypothetical protein
VRSDRLPQETQQDCSTISRFRWSRVAQYLSDREREIRFNTAPKGPAATLGIHLGARGSVRSSSSGLFAATPQKGTLITLSLLQGHLSQVLHIPKCRPKVITNECVRFLATAQPIRRLSDKISELY